MKSFAGLNIPWLIQGNEQYGVRSATLYLTMALRDRGVSTPMIAIQDGEFAAECRDHGMQVTALGHSAIQPLSGSLMTKLTMLPKLRREQELIRQRLRNTLADSHIDALHFRWPSMVPIAGPVARELGVPAFWQMPNYVGDGYPFGLNRLYYQAHCYRHGIVPLANSRFTASTLGSLMVTPKVFHLAADVARFSPENVRPHQRASLGIPDDAVVLCVVARLDPSKGQRRILEAMLRIVADGHNLHLLLVGGPTDSAEAQSLMTDAISQNARSRLHLVGHVPDPERLYGVVDIAINSRIDAEPFGLSVIEAMLMGRPVLVHALGGPAETVLDGLTGWHVASPDVTSFEKGLRRALADKPKWAEMGKEARRHALEHFSSQGQAERYLHIIQDFI
jgi:glycosyltransferase involved in cell wall biosynthesis